MPSNAELLLDDLAAHRALERHDLPCPPQLTTEAIRKRFLTPLHIHQIGRDEFDREVVVFKDESSIMKHDGKWCIVMGDV